MNIMFSWNWPNFGVALNNVSCISSDKELVSLDNEPDDTDNSIYVFLENEDIDTDIKEVKFCDYVTVTNRLLQGQSKGFLLFTNYT